MYVFCDPVTHLCNQSEPFENLGRGPPDEFGQITISGSRKEVE